MIEHPEKPTPRDQTVDDVIADGDARAAVDELLAIIRSLIHENETLRESRRRDLRGGGRLSLAGRNDAPRTVCWLALKAAAELPQPSEMMRKRAVARERDLSMNVETGPHIFTQTGPACYG